eukprot:CAMPEP_0118645952 /NCGR_PEP_ID=MMETSP0785-20121206/7783_1 /TAXON_ID=91992 /ORGANISM="Bolidomonas pacifica, Strain CCMP 1866" /LENGTH=429 /DNA_ID=CAMNT_0006537885 /DNA_START=26 /DNA_END=1315 /DNA_ORIENTATION=+
MNEIEQSGDSSDDEELLKDPFGDRSSRGQTSNQNTERNSSLKTITTSRAKQQVSNTPINHKQITVSSPETISAYVGACPLPKVLKLSDLAWYSIRKVPHPVRICPSEEGHGLRLNKKCYENMRKGKQGGWDESKLLVVQYIVCPMGEYQLVEKRRLRSWNYENEGEDNVDGKKWSKKLMQQWEQWGKKNRGFFDKSDNSKGYQIHRDMEFADRIIRAVREMPIAEADEIDDLDIHSPSNDDDVGYDSESSVSSLREVHENPTPEYDPIPYDRKEEIKPGDTILYYDPIFRAGDKRGRRETSVLEVKAKNKGMRLVLANNAVLADDQSICRVKIFDKDKGMLIPHSGVFRHVSEYVLRSAKISPDMEKAIGIEREGDRIRRIAVEGVKKFKEKHGGEGFFRDDNRGYRGKKRRRKGGHETLRRPKIRRYS